MTKRSIPQPRPKADRLAEIKAKTPTVSHILLSGYKTARADLPFEKMIALHKGRVRQVSLKLEDFSEVGDVFLTVVIASDKTTTSHELQIKDGKLFAKNLDSLIMEGDMLEFTLNIGCEVVYSIDIEV